MTIRHAHTRYICSGRVASPSQRPLSTHHTTKAREIRQCPQRNSNSGSQQSSGRRPYDHLYRPSMILLTFDQRIFLEIYDTRIILRHILKSELFGGYIRVLWKHLHKQDSSDSSVISPVVRFIDRGRVIFQLPCFTPLCYLD